MTLTPEQAKRRAEMVELRERGLSLSLIGECFGISRQRVHEILKAAKRDAQRERCAGGHGPILRGEYEAWRDGEMVKLPAAWCRACGARIE